MAPAVRIRPYKDFLTPVMHKRFMNAAGVLYVLCYAETLLLSDWNSFFAPWFRAIVGAGLLFITGFVIIIMRVANLHVGVRTTTSGIETLQQCLVEWQQTGKTIGWYVFSAWLFSEIYIWSAPSSANIWWITHANNYERPRLNERPIYLTTYFITLSIWQACRHMHNDWDRIDMPIMKVIMHNGTNDVKEITKVVSKPREQLLHGIIPIMRRAATYSMGATLLTPFVNSIFLREFTWGWTRNFAKIFWSLPKSTALPATTPYHMYTLWRTWSGGFLLIMVWELANVAFSAYVVQEPSKKDRPPTFESRDPNGSLLTGLKGKKLHTRAFAFWELVTIAQQLEGRRKTIYEDIDRAGGSTWSQILDAGLEVIEGITKRIAEYQTPAGQPAPAAADIPSLPRISVPLKDENIFAAAPPPKDSRDAALEAVGQFARSHGLNNSDDGLTPRARKFIDQAKTSFLSPEQQQAVSATNVKGVFHQYALEFIRWPLGKPFRQIYCRRLAAVVLGTPYGDAGVIIDAIVSLTRLAVSSLAEDTYGRVQTDVPTLIRTFTATIVKLDAFVKGFELHWTDADGRKDVGEVKAIMVHLQRGLRELVEAFGPFSDDLRLTRTEMRLAREASTEAPHYLNERL